MQVYPEYQQYLNDVEALVQQITEDGFQWVEDGHKIIELCHALANLFPVNGSPAIVQTPRGPVAEYFRSDRFTTNQERELFDYLTDRLLWYAALCRWQANESMVRAFAGLYIQAVAFGHFG